MTRDVVYVTPDMTVKDVVDLINKTGYNGFPVVQDGKVVGIVTARDLLLQDPSRKVREVMSKRVLVTTPDAKISDVARIMFRSGISRLPVVDRENKLIGIITNMDVLRSHIERSTPTRVESLRRLIENLHKVRVSVEVRDVEIDKLRPTQPRVHIDELEGRKYELKKGLAEPMIVINNDGELVLVDGHHRAVAAKQLGIKRLRAYILKPSRKIELGLLRTAERQGLRSLDDIKIVGEPLHTFAWWIVSGGVGE